MRPDRSRPGRRALFASVLLHVAFFALLFSGVAQPAPLPKFKAYKVELVAAPPPAPVVKETPAPEKESEPEPTPEKKSPVKTPAPKPESKAEPPKPEPKPQPSKEKKESEKQPASTPNEKKTTGAGKDALDMSLKGEEFPYPVYLENVTTQIHRYFRWMGTSHPVAEVAFVINKDGSVGDIRFVRRSGNAAFDFEAIGAIEQAGRRRAFGPLPEGFKGDNLPVLFRFGPSQ